MSTIFKTISWRVDGLVPSVESGAISLPDLQRPFVWPSTKVRDLLDSMYRGYPVGELMFWDVTAESETRAIGADGGLTAKYQIVDGQQRLTSLYAVVTGKRVLDSEYRSKDIKISFNPFDERFEVWTPVIAKSPYWIDDVSTFFKAPLKRKKEFIQRLLSEDVSLSDDEDERIELVLQKLAEILSYQFEVVHIQEDVAKRTVADIFVRINSEGVNLKAYDYILTWFSVFWPSGRDQIERFARHSRITVDRANEIREIDSPKVNWTAKNHFIDIETGQLVRVLVALGQNRAKLSDAYSALQAKDRSTGAVDADRQETELTLLKSAIDDVLRPSHWDEFTNCLPLAGFRSKKGITSQTNLVSTYVIWLIGRLRFKVPIHDLRIQVARWFFMAQITSRYTGSGETQLQKDLDRFGRAIAHGEKFEDTVDEVINSVLTPDFWTFRMPESLVTSNAALSPSYQTYLAALNVLNADMFMLKMPVTTWMDPTRQPVRGLEGHHLFPKAYLRDELGIDDLKLINQAANFAPTDWDTNLLISDRPPLEYWPELVEARATNDKGWLSKQYDWHALPANWEGLDFEEFLAARRKLMAKVTRTGFEQLSQGRGAVIALANPAFLEADESWSIGELISRGILNVGDSLVPVNDSIKGESLITEGETILVEGMREFDTLDDAARWLDVTNIPGTELFAKVTEEGNLLISELIYELFQP